MRVEAQSFHLKVITSEKAARLVQTSSYVKNPQALVEAVQTFVRTRVLHVFNRLALGAAIAGILYLVLKIWPRVQPVMIACGVIIGDTFTVWGLVAGAATMGFGLFWIRSHYRLSYGTIEVLIGLFGVGKLANPKLYDSNFTYQVICCLYIIVRGLDNVEKGLKGTSLEQFWIRVFGDRDSR